MNTTSDGAGLDLGVPDEDVMHDSVESAKKAMRTTLRQTVRALPRERCREASAAACARLVRLDAFREATIVMLYLPLAAEVDTTAAAIEAFASGKTVCVPRVDWDRNDMQAVAVDSFDDEAMDVGEHLVRSPRGGRLVPPGTIDLVVVPGLAFDDHGRRLGRGGGYYDRFLPRLRRSARAIGIAFDEQVVGEVPSAVHDRAMDLVVTDRRITAGRPSRSGA